MKRIGLVLGLLSCAVGSAAFAWRMWDWALNFDPGFTFSTVPVPTGSPSSAGVTILLVDGLRLDASRRMQTLNALRLEGADIEAQVGTPSFSRPGRATVAVGAYPAIHGVTSNRQKREIPLDNIIRRVGAMGGTCRIAGSKIWSSLFGKDIERCGVYRAGEAKEGPGAFVRQVPDVRASQEAGIAFILQEPAMLRIADIISTDFAAHEYGGTSPEYLSEVQRTDVLLGELVRTLDLTKETLIVTSDHGHRDAGGHGGEEAEVLSIPIVMVGAGIKPGAVAKASQADIAPTVAALLGAALPAASSGRPLESVLALEESGRVSLNAAVAAQRAAFERAVGERLGVTADPRGRTDWASLVIAHRDADKKGRIPYFILAALLIPALTFAAVRVSKASDLGLLAGLAAVVLGLLGPIGARIPTMSFSAINYDEMLVPFFVRILTLVAVGTLTGALVAAGVGQVFRRRPTLDTAFERAGSMGLVLAAALSVMTAAWWWSFDLLSPVTLPGSDALVQAYSLTLATFSASVTTIVLMMALRIIEGAGRSRGAAADSASS